ncbi:MAG: response regulator transcription factor [Tannerellaceae bacterium]|nr:response regulator transcription factor [Tannerellaceae bacterium]
MAKILLVEDEVNIASFIERGLQEFDHQVTVAYDGTAGWEIVRQELFDLLVLDVIMPGMTGLQLCRQYRDLYGYASPVLMLTALGTTEDIVAGLDAGADDYLVKPFSFQELQARIHALLRRAKRRPEEPVLQCGELMLEPANHRAVRAGKPIDLTVREYRLLEYLVKNQGNALSRAALLREVWEKEADGDRNTNVVDVYVNYLRSKIDKGFDRKMIRTVTGIGYRVEG